MPVFEVPDPNPQPGLHTVDLFPHESGGTTSISAYRLLMQDPVSKLSRCLGDVQHAFDVAVLGYN
jgi:hypothetical protein